MRPERAGNEAGVMHQPWCVCRWTSARTAMALRMRGERSDAAERESMLFGERTVSLCGPLSKRDVGYSGLSGTSGLNIELQLGSYGFPGGRLGKLATWGTCEDAQSEIDSGLFGDQRWTKVDIPAPVASLEFCATVYDHYDGSSVELIRGDYGTVLTEWAIARIDIGRSQLALLSATPIRPEIEQFLPTPEQAARMWDIDARNEASSGFARNEQEQARLASIRSELGVSVDADLLTCAPGGREMRRS